MYSLMTCIVQQHNLFLAGAAGVLCLLATSGSVVFLGQARATADAWARAAWVAFAACTGGFGIWATHFVAILAYEPGIDLGFNLNITIASLLIAILANLVAGSAAVALRGPEGDIASGLAFGTGVSAMHFAGMAALDFGGYITWSVTMVAAAVFLPIILGVAGFFLARRPGFSRLFGAAVVLAAAVLVMHFLAMGAGQLVMDPALARSEGVLPKHWVVTAILVAAGSLILFGLALVAMTARADRSTKQANNNFELLVAGVTDYAIYMLDREGVINSWNAGAERAKGYKASEIVGHHFSRFYSQDDQVANLPSQALRQALQHRRFEADGWRYRKDGTRFWANVVIQPVRDDAGAHIGYAKITRDITLQKANNDRVAKLGRNLDLALENMSQGICLFDEEERLVLSNRQYREMFGFSDQDIAPGMTYREIVELGYIRVLADGSEALLRAREHYDRFQTTMSNGEKQLLHLTSNGRSIQVNFNLVKDGGWVATFEDITTRTQTEEQVRFLARHDGLTKLPNRNAVRDFLEHELRYARNAATSVAVLAIDLDRFRVINDQLGHALGERFLIELSQRLEDALADHEMVARTGGDEFVAVKRYSQAGELDSFVARLTDALTSGVEVEGNIHACAASIGVACYPRNGADTKALLANADSALSRSKQSLSKKVCFYDDEMDEAARERTRMARDLRVAIEQQQFHLHYQVQKSASSEATTGYEVLLRWHHPERGNVSPADFIGIAEECGAILPIGEWVLKEACRQAASWTSGYKIAVNLSPVQLANADIASLVRSVLQETGLDPKRLELEITESSIIVDKARTLAVLMSIKSLGVSIAIDDFGTGYSSLETLRSFPFDKIKLDKSFIAEVQDSDQSKGMVRAVLALGQSLQIPVLAEGVETREQLNFLKLEGCHEVQGYLLGRPMPHAEALDAAA